MCVLNDLVKTHSVSERVRARARVYVYVCVCVRVCKHAGVDVCVRAFSFLCLIS